MDPAEKGYFTAYVKDLGGRKRYSYLLNGVLQRPDPVSRFQPEGVHGPSEVIDPDAFQWEDQGWKGVPLDELIVYEIHTGTFTREGTFEAIVPLLDYLSKELRITAIELMPIAQFPGERNWGYDGASPYAPQNSYGGPHGLKSFINQCHRRGLAVILDVVYNHLGPEGNYLGDYGPYFTDRYGTPWGPAINFDGPESDDVRRFFIDNALYWITEYHFDGLRIDAVHGIFDFSARHILDEIREALHRQAAGLGRPVLAIAESNLNDVRVINSPRKGGYGLDAQWNDDFHHCLHALLTKEQEGYYRDFGEINQLAKALREGFVYSGQYSSFRRRRHGSSSKHLPPDKFIIFSQNHDQVGNRMKGERLSALVSFEALKLAAAVVLLSPNIPLLFMGEEYGEKAPFQYFIRHSDQALIEAVKRGRREEFASFQWKEGLPDPQEEATFLRSKIDFGLRGHENHKLLLDFYKALIRLRKEIPSLSHLTKAGMKVNAFRRHRTLILRRQYGEDRVFCVLHFDDQPAEVPMAIGGKSWRKIIDSSSRQWGGIGSSVPESLQPPDSEVMLKLNATSFVLFRGEAPRPEGRGRSTIPPDRLVAVRLIEPLTALSSSKGFPVR
jgi:maltooligosyltrehalose trehalohydrolase